MQWASHTGSWPGGPPQVALRHNPRTSPAATALDTTPTVMLSAKCRGDRAPKGDPAAYSADPRADAHGPAASCASRAAAASAQGAELAFVLAARAGIAQPSREAAPQAITAMQACARSAAACGCCASSQPQDRSPLPVALQLFLKLRRLPLALPAC